MTSDEAAVNIFLNLAANILTAIVGAVGAYVTGWLPKRAQQRWMGMVAKQPSLQIYTSNLKIKRGGTEAVEGETITAGFVGSAMNEREYQSALKLRDSLRPSRIIEVFAELINRRLEQTDVHVCPPKWDERRAPLSNLVFLGSPIYNSGTKYYLQDNRRIKFVLSTDNKRVLKIEEQEFTRKSEPDGTPNPSDDVGMICRTNKGGRSIFICAGLGTEGTCDAANHLAVRWRSIREMCGSREFIILLRRNPQTGRPEPRYLYVEERQGSETDGSTLE